MRHSIDKIISFLPEIEKGIRRVTQTRPIEEIRLHLGQRVIYCFHGGYVSDSVIVDRELLQNVLDRATQRSCYATIDMLRRGYLILQGGHRLGVCGTGVYRDMKLRSLRDISSLNIRIARDVRGFGNMVADCLWTNPRSALCIGPPGQGKTTLLRDVIRQLSQRFHQRVAVVDERQEIAACVDGRPQFELGPTTDVLSAVGKAEGIEMLLRSMSPDWIALDEITATSDVQAMIHASYCGVKFLATAHAGGKEDLYARPMYRDLMSGRVFDLLFTIDQNREVRKEYLAI